MNDNERISKARIRLLYAFPFFGSLVSRLNIRVTESKEHVTTACVTPSGTVIFNKEFLDSLSDAEVTGTLVHEVLHVALNYWSRAKDRNVLLFCGGRPVPAFNVAQDYAINQIITDMITNDPKADWIGLGKGCLLDEKYRHWSAEKIYDDIIKHAKKIAFFVPDVSEGNGSDEDKATEAKAKEWREHLLSARREHQRRKGNGTLPDVLQCYIDSLLPPKVPWNELLQNWLGDNYGGATWSYRRPCRRQQSDYDFILPGTDRNNLPRITILWDTSGSMTGYVQLVFNELANILQVLRAPIEVILCDTEVKGIFPSLQQAEALAGQIKGGGGSDFCPAFAEAKDPTSVILAFTDGFITVPTEPPLQKVLWILTPDGQDPTNDHYGEIIRLPEEDKQKE